MQFAKLSVDTWTLPTQGPETEFTVSVDVFIAVLKVIEMLAVCATPLAPSAGTVLTTVGCGTQVPPPLQTPVVQTVPVGAKFDPHVFDVQSASAHSGSATEHCAALLHCTQVPEPSHTPLAHVVSTGCGEFSHAPLVVLQVPT
jgi:hypothetical protein